MMLVSLFVFTVAFLVQVADLEAGLLAVQSILIDESDCVRGEILVKFREGISREEREGVHRAFGLGVLSEHRGGVQRLRIPDGQTEHEILSLLEGDPRVEYAELNTICHGFFIPNDTYYSFQWHFPRVNCALAWEISTGEGVVVGILDSGIAYEDYPVPAHESRTVRAGIDSFKQAPDLAGTSFVPGYDFINDDSHPNDNHGHGTHVAGTVAQTTNNGSGVAGMAFDCTLMPVKVLDYKNAGTAQALADGLYWATDHGAQVINMSLGWRPRDNPGATVENAIAYAYNQGVVLVAAAGDYGWGTVSYPAAYPEVIAVGATRYDDQLAHYSQYGSEQELVAPGGDLGVDQNGDVYADGVLQQTFQRYQPSSSSGSRSLSDPTDFSYEYLQGASMAAPHVSALAAMMIANGQTGVENVRTILHETAVDLGAPGWDETYGWGLIDAYAALTYGNGVQTPVVNSVQIENVTLTHTDDYIKDGDDAQLIATATDDDPGFGISNVTADLRGLGGGANVAPDSYVDGSATWTIPGVTCSPSDGAVTVTVTAVDPAGSTASGIDDIVSDNALPGGVTGFTAQPGHGKTTLSWDDPSGLDANYYGMLVRYDGGGDYPQYGTLGSYPSDVLDGNGDAFDGTGAGPEIHTIVPRDIYYYTAFAYDRAMNYGPAVSSAQDRATNYYLADLGSGDGRIPSDGYDGRVDFDDLFPFSTRYSMSNPTGTDAEADFGPTVASGGYTTAGDHRLGIPSPDGVVDFRDLMILGMNYDSGVSRPIPLEERIVADRLGLELRGEWGVGEGGQHLDVTVYLANDGHAVKGVSAMVRFDPSYLSVREVVSGSVLGVDGEDALVLHRVGDGMVQLDGVVLGADRGTVHSGDVGVTRFTVYGAEIGDLEFGEVWVRDVANADLGVSIGGLSLASSALPTRYALSQNHPNPFNPETTIRYDVPSLGPVSVVVYDVTGRTVRVLVDGDRMAGRHRVVWDGRDGLGRAVGSGVYLYRMEAWAYRATGKMVLIQ